MKNDEVTYFPIFSREEEEAITGKKVPMYCENVLCREKDALIAYRVESAKSITYLCKHCALFFMGQPVRKFLRVV